MSTNSIVTERALREIYLKPFQTVQQICPPWTYISSYNRVNGIHISEDRRLLQDVLRDEWGYDGLIMLDWFATYSSSEAILAGLDLEMPGPSYARGDTIRHAMAAGKLKEYHLDGWVKQLLKLVKKVIPLGLDGDTEEKGDDNPETNKILRTLARESIVLLKNENSILPLDPRKSTAAIGPNAAHAAFCGGGSTMMTPYYAISPLEGLKAQFKDVNYALGCAGWKKLPPLSRLTETRDGRPGIDMTVYLEPSTVDGRRVVDEMYVADSAMDFCDYIPDDVKDGGAFYADFTGTLRPEVSADYEFSCNVLGTVRIYVDSKLLIDNATSQTRGDSFFGQGTRDEVAKVFLEKGRKYEIRADFGSLATSPLDVPLASAFGGGGLRLGCSRVFDSQDEIKSAVDLAKQCEQVVLCVGLNGEWELEGVDRQSMNLPGLTEQLIRDVVAANPRTAIVVQSGTPVTMPWIDAVPAVLQAWYGGNETGNAIADVVAGVTSSSAKLPLTFPIRLEDNPTFLNFGSQGDRVLYGEDVFVGYRF